MQITSLYIDDYKLLKKFRINFQKDVSILIGINGSGKSTILESIAQIFSDAILNDKSKFGFSIEYELRLEEILEQTATTSEFRTDYIRVEISTKRKDEELSYKVFVANEILERREDIEKRFNTFSKILPSNIVIYYSGLSDIMKAICNPHDQTLSKQYREGNSNVSKPFFYFDQALFELILISLLSYEYGEIPEFLLDKAKINSFQSIQIRLKKPYWVKKQKITDWWGAKGEVKTFLDYINSLFLPLIIEENSKHDYSKGNVVIEAWENEALNITILGREKLFQIREYCIDERTLFKILSALYIDGFWNNAEIIYKNSEGNSFNTLSEGETQSITIKGLTELLTNENTLFLFDEPDTYLHPSWQRNFIENILTHIANNSAVMSQFIITTHSPQILSNADPDRSDVQIMEEGEVVKITPKYFGRDISTILYELMGVERRNKKVTKSLSVLFNLIEDGELEKAKEEYKTLSELIGEDDPAIIRAKTQLDYLEEANNEEDNKNS